MMTSSQFDAGTRVRRHSRLTSPKMRRPYAGSSASLEFDKTSPGNVMTSLNFDDVTLTDDAQLGLRLIALAFTLINSGIFGGGETNGQQTPILTALDLKLLGDELKTRGEFLAISEHSKNGRAY